MNNNKYSFQSHLDSGNYEKRVWWWPTKWYVKPWAISWGEWEKEDAFFKKNYSVQYFLRDTVYYFFFGLHRSYKELKWDIKGHIKNPRKQMRDKVFPHRWNDLSHSIVTFHLEAIVEFVDREKCFENTDYDSDDFHKDFAKGLKECYDYVKNVRPKWQKDLDDAFNRVPSNPEGEYKEIYKEVNEIEAKIDEHDTKVCEWVIENRAYFWC